MKPPRSECAQKGAVRVNCVCKGFFFFWSSLIKLLPVSSPFENLWYKLRAQLCLECMYVGTVWPPHSCQTSS